MAVNKRERVSERLPVKTARVPEKTWARASRRAVREGTTISNVVATFVAGYADGLVNLPEVHVTWSKQGDLTVTMPAPAESTPEVASAAS